MGLRVLDWHSLWGLDPFHDDMIAISQEYFTLCLMSVHFTGLLYKYIVIAVFHCFVTCSQYDRNPLLWYCVCCSVVLLYKYIRILLKGCRIVLFYCVCIYIYILIYVYKLLYIFVCFFVFVRMSLFIYVHYNIHTLLHEFLSDAFVCDNQTTSISSSQYHFKIVVGLFAVERPITILALPFRYINIMCILAR